MFRRTVLSAMAHGNFTLLGKHVRALRKAKGLSQEALADLSDVHRNFIGFIGSIERSERNIGLFNLIKLAGGFDVTFNKLLDKSVFEVREVEAMNMACA
ncbi:MAG: helix-turn-helix transcriptional regulator [Paracoccaceae bacterium]